MRLLRRCLPVVLAALATSASAQAPELFAVGAQWNYRLQPFRAPPRTVTYLAVRDTTVRGLTCLVLDRGGEPPTCNTPRDMPRAVFCDDGPRRYYYEPRTDSLHVLADLSLQPGDSLSVPVYYADGAGGSYRTDVAYVRSADTVAVAGRALRRQRLRVRGVVDYGNGPDTSFADVTAVEGIGLLSSPFGPRVSLPNGLCDGDYLQDLECFSAAGAAGATYPDGASACPVVSSVGDVAGAIERVTAYPSATAGETVVGGLAEAPAGSRLRVFDALGRASATYAVPPGAEAVAIDLAPVAAGTAHLVLVAPGGGVLARATVLRVGR